MRECWCRQIRGGQLALGGCCALPQSSAVKAPDWARTGVGSPWNKDACGNCIYSQRLHPLSSEFCLLALQKIKSKQLSFSVFPLGLPCGLRPDSRGRVSRTDEHGFLSRVQCNIFLPSQFLELTDGTPCSFVHLGSVPQGKKSPVMGSPAPE